MDVLENRPPKVDSDSGLGIGALTEREWNEVVASLELSPQQARIAELVMKCKPDKQIAREMRVSVGTVRTYLTRLFQRTRATDRVGLVMSIFARARELRERAGGKRR